MKPKIVVIGSTNTDMIIKVPHIPAPGETVLGGDFSIIQGGKGANQAVATARAGGQVTFISCVGDDVFGKQSLAELAKDGIDISAIKVVEGYSSGVALINVSENGENSISVAPGANSRLLPEDIDKYAHFIKDANIVLLQLEIPIETVKRAIKIANEHKVRVILNPAPGRDLDSSLLKNIDVLTPNQHEAALIGQVKGQSESYSHLAEALVEKGANTVILTLGRNGAYLLEMKNQTHIPGYEVVAVDTTAAGDTFNGYLAFSLGNGDDMLCAIKIANKAASISVTRFGAQPSIPKMAEVNSRIYEHY
jgi:ribokinase